AQQKSHARNPDERVCFRRDRSPSCARSSYPPTTAACGGAACPRRCTGGIVPRTGTLHPMGPLESGQGDRSGTRWPPTVTACVLAVTSRGLSGWIVPRMWARFSTCTGRRPDRSLGLDRSPNPDLLLDNRRPNLGAFAQGSPVRAGSFPVLRKIRAESF